MQEDWDDRPRDYPDEYEEEDMKQEKADAHNYGVMHDSLPMIDRE